mmetsp:Transcript_30285/g.66614  ORF Transcript_30285/g.66614 Transcript_30285/m.66614 type:complete len:147 (-) Transcript_30285:100-540(-)
MPRKFAARAMPVEVVRDKNIRRGFVPIAFMRSSELGCCGFGGGGDDEVGAGSGTASWFSLFPAADCLMESIPLRRTLRVYDDGGAKAAPADADARVVKEMPMVPRHDMSIAGRIDSCYTAILFFTSNSASPDTLYIVALVDDVMAW